MNVEFSKVSPEFARCPPNSPTNSQGGTFAMVVPLPQRESSTVPVKPTRIGTMNMGEPRKVNNHSPFDQGFIHTVLFVAWHSH
jgi:hypothetical protein